MRGDGPPPGLAAPFETWPSVLKSTLSLILASEAQIVMFTGPDFLAFYNDAYAPAIGMKHPRALGGPAAQNWGEFWEDLEGLLSHVRRTGEAVTEKDRRFFTERFGYPETVYFDIAFSPVRGCDGVIEAVLCIVSETTARVLALRDLNESEARMQAVLSSAKAGLCTVTASGKITTVNAQFASLIGTAPETLIGQKLQNLIDPRDWRAEFLTSHLHSAPHSELRYRRADGQVIWVAQVITEVLSPEGARAFCLLTRDITDKRREEIELQRMAAIIEGSDDAILAMDLEMNITSWNRGAERLYGWRAEEIIGTSIMRLLPEERGDEETVILEKVRAGKRVETYETTRLCRAGREIPVSLTVSPIYDLTGEIIGASKISRDISARIEAQKLREFLLFEMKHRVKNILATVVALARQALARLDLPEYDAFIARVHALSRSQDLLTRQDRGAVFLDALIEEVLEPFQSERFTITGPALLVQQDTVLSFTLALHELVTNALKYGALSTPEGRVSIQWRLVKDAEDCPPRVQLFWRESGGPMVIKPSRKGFGSVLIRDLLASTLQAEITLVYAPSGVELSADFPLGSVQLPITEPSEPA